MLQRVRLVIASLVTPGVLGLACGGTTAADDAGADATADVHKDVQLPDVGIPDVPVDTGSACVPSLLDAYTPSWVPPASPQSVCTPSQIQTLYDECVGPNRSAGACNAFEGVTANVTCTSCVETPLGSSAYGATMTWNNANAQVANVAGCVALVDGDTSSTGCGAKYQAWDACVIDACDYCPPGTFTSCSTVARTTTCGAYEAAAQCANDPKYAICHQTTFESYFTTFGAMFCAAGASDAGTD